MAFFFRETSYNNDTADSYNNGFKRTWIDSLYTQKVKLGIKLSENYFSFRRRSGAEPTRLITYQGSPPAYARFRDYYGGPYDMRQMCTSPTNGYFGVNTYQVYAGTPGDVNEASKVAWRLRGMPTLVTESGNKLSKKLQSKDIDLGVALGEARETAYFIQGTLISLFKSARRARKGDLSGVLKELGLSKTPDPLKQRLRDVPDAAAKAWLGWSYAVRPLLADVEGAVKALDKRHERPTLVTVRAQSTEKVDINLATSNGVKLYPSFGRDVYLTLVGEYGCRQKITFQVNNPVLYKLSQVGLTNPLSVAWELLTLSFVIDWFIPVGDYLGSLVPPQGVSNVSRTETTFGKFWGRGGFKTFSGELPCSINEQWKERNWLSSFPRYHVVGATFDLGRSQIASGISLLWSFGSGESRELASLRSAERLHSLGTNERKFRGLRI